MDPNAWTQLISSVGFPIVACGMMWKALQDTTKAHQEEMAVMRESINQNTVILAQLKTLIEQISAAIQRDP